MGMKNITDRILADARKRASEIESEGNRKSADILDEARKEGQSLKAQIISSAEAQAKEEKRRILAFARLEARNSILAAKQEEVSTVFEKALDHLMSLSDQEYVQLVKGLLTKAVVTGDEEVILSSGDKNRITQGFIEDVNQALVTASKKGGLKIAEETRGLQGGFVLRSAGVEINSSFPSRLEQLREELEYKILEMIS